MNSNKRFLNWWTILAALVIGLLGAISIASIHMSIGPDTQKLRCSTWWIMQGMTPYKVLIEFNQPGTILYFAALLTVSLADECFRIADQLVLALCAWLLWRLGAGNNFRLAPALCFVGFHLMFLGANGTMQRELVVVCCFLGAATLIFAKRGKTSMVMAGLLIGYASTVKVNAILFAVPLAIFALTTKQAKRWWVLPGIAIPWVVTIAWIEKIQVMPDFVWTMTELTPFYAGDHSYGFMPSTPMWMRFTFMALVLLVSTLALIRSPSRHNVMWSMALLGIVHVVAQNKGFPYHFIPLVAFGSLALMETAQRLEWIGVRMIAVGLALTWPVMYFVPSDEAHVRALEEAYPATPSLMGVIEKLPRDARIQPLAFVDDVPNALFRTGRLPATGMQYDLCLFMGSDSKTRRGMRDRFFSEVQLRPPDYFVTAKASDPRGYDKFKAWPEFAEWLQDHYTMESFDNDAFRVYRRNDLVTSR
ncbi:MAG: hypothetical protein WCT24_00685 [Patescibacteria group bacterium]